MSNINIIKGKTIKIKNLSIILKLLDEIEIYKYKPILFINIEKITSDQNLKFLINRIIDITDINHVIFMSNKDAYYENSLTIQLNYLMNTNFEKFNIIFNDESNYWYSIDKILSKSIIFGKYLFLYIDISIENFSEIKVMFDNNNISYILCKYEQEDFNIFNYLYNFFSEPKYEIIKNISYYGYDNLDL